jgi:DNA-directed RNA polymerase subunit RPC12/RpoP
MFMHTYRLEFRCACCGNKLTEFATSSDALTKEDLDQIYFNVKCDACGWNRMRKGFYARETRAAFDPAPVCE